jgi:hypothetical protein
MSKLMELSLVIIAPVLVYAYPVKNKIENSLHLIFYEDLFFATPVIQPSGFSLHRLSRIPATICLFTSSPGTRLADFELSSRAQSFRIAGLPISD